MAQDKDVGISKGIIKVLKELGPKEDPELKKKKKKKKKKKELILEEDDSPVELPAMVTGSF